MPANDTQVTITQGFSTDSPWVIDELDTNLKNLALARLAALGASQGDKLETQTKVLIEQTNQLENLQEFTDKLGSGTVTALVMDSSGAVLISDPKVVSDLAGRSAASLSATEVNRLIEFTASLANSSPSVNLGGQTYVSVSVRSGTPPTDKVIQAPLKVWSSDPKLIAAADVQPFACYAYKDSSGTLLYRICDETKTSLTITSIATLANPAAAHVYDAYRIGTKVYKPQDILGAFPTSPSGTLYRNIVTGQLRLVTDSGYTDDPEATGFVIPASQDEITFWLGQAASDRLRLAETQFNTDGIKMPVSPDTFQWKYMDTAFVGGGFAIYPPVQKSPTDTTLNVGTFVQDPSDTAKKIYLITGKEGTTNKYVEVQSVGEPFNLRLTQDNIVSIRGQYTEKITQMTQRTTEQQLFLNSLLQKHNYQLDAATNVLKAFNDLNNRLSNLV